MQNEKGHTTTYRNVAFSEWLRHFAINTLYPSYYLTITTQGYTKYYYAGGTRIASRLGSGGFEKMTRLCSLDQNMTYNANSLFYGVVARIGEDMPQESVSYPCPTYYNDMAFEVSLPDLNFGPNFGITAQQNVLQAFRQNYANEETYFFHGNHLGSANVITTPTALPVQFMLHLPYGEEFVKQLSGTYDERFTFTGKEKDIETGYYYFGARFDNVDLGFLSVDQMSDKYPGISPYAYCAWNPVKHIDPNGKEKLIWLNKDKDKTIISGAGNYKDNGAIHIFAHGSSKGMTVEINGKRQRVATGKQLEKLLSKHSTIWKNKKDGSNIIIVLHSCRTGEGDNSFAQKVSKELNVTVIAPDQRDYFSKYGEIGPYKAKYTDKNNEYLRDNNGDIISKERSNEMGNWRVFKNGEEKGAFRGRCWNPKE